MSRLSISEFADRAGELMQFVMREFVKYQINEFHKLKVTLPQFFVLESLYRSGECKMSDIAKYINVTTAAMTGVVERLVRDGYVVRTSDDKDRRIVMVKLTPKGNAVLMRVMRKRKEAFVKVFGMISQEEREQYLNILTHIRDHLK